MGKTCFFVGSHDAPERIMDVLQGSVELHIIDDGVTDFYVGNHGSFDRMAAHAVIQAKKRYPKVRLILVQAYHPSRQRYSLPKGFDESVYPEGLELVPERLAVLKANHLMIDRVDHLITYVDHGAGNAKKLSDYAKRRTKRGELKIEDIYAVTMAMEKPWDLELGAAVLVVSQDDGVIPLLSEVESQMQGLVAQGFRVMIVDITSPFGQLAAEVLLEQRKSFRQITVCCFAGKPAHQRANARAKYSDTEGYLELCVSCDCTYFYDKAEEVMAAAAYVCTENGLSSTETRQKAVR